MVGELELQSIQRQLKSYNYQLYQIIFRSSWMRTNRRARKISETFIKNYRPIYEVPLYEVYRSII